MGDIFGITDAIIGAGKAVDDASKPLKAPHSQRHAVRKEAAANQKSVPSDQSATDASASQGAETEERQAIIKDAKEVFKQFAGKRTAENEQMLAKLHAITQGLFAHGSTPEEVSNQKNEARGIIEDAKSLLIAGSSATGIRRDTSAKGANSTAVKDEKVSSPDPKDIPGTTVKDIAPVTANSNTSGGVQQPAKPIDIEAESKKTFDGLQSLFAANESKKLELLKRRSENFASPDSLKEIDQEFNALEKTQNELKSQISYYDRAFKQSEIQKARQEKAQKSEAKISGAGSNSDPSKVEDKKIKAEVKDHRDLERERETLEKEFIASVNQSANQAAQDEKNLIAQQKTPMMRDYVPGAFTGFFRRMSTPKIDMKKLRFEAARDILLAEAQDDQTVSVGNRDSVRKMAVEYSRVMMSKRYKNDDLATVASKQKTSDISTDEDLS